MPIDTFGVYVYHQKMKSLNFPIQYHPNWHLIILIRRDFEQLLEDDMRRQRMSKKRSHRNFKRGAGVNRKNIAPAPTRGGYRL